MDFHILVPCLEGNFETQYSWNLPYLPSKDSEIQLKGHEFKVLGIVHSVDDQTGIWKTVIRLKKIYPEMRTGKKFSRRNTSILPMLPTDEEMQEAFTPIEVRPPKVKWDSN